MRRDGHVIEEIVDWGNLQSSFDTVVRGTERKEMVEGKWLTAHREEFLRGVREEIMSGEISLMPLHRKPTATEKRTGGYTPKVIKEGGKVRNIQVFCMAARIKVNAVMSVVDAHLQRRYIRTTSASIKGRGMHELKQYIERDMKECPEIRYWYKFDIRKFYDTVRQDFVMFALRRIFKDKTLLGILDAWVHLMPDGIGMSMGHRASQGTCNVLLSVFLDHYMKDRYRVKHYYRYCDDGLVGAETKAELWKIRDAVHERIESIEQEVKGNERIFSVEDGLDFLGYVIYPSHSLLRKRVKKSYAKRLREIKSRKRREAVIGSLWGLTKHCNGWNLTRSMLYPSEINKLKRKRMKAFKDLNIVYQPEDGKKRFKGKTVQLRQLVNLEIEVMDYELGVRTQNGERCLVQYRDPRDGGMYKFFTASAEMIQALEKVAEIDELPFKTVIAVEYFGENKSKYKFT